MPARNPELDLIEDIAGFFDDPYGFVLYVFPWGEPGLMQEETGPDQWQCDILKDLGDAVRRNGDMGEAIRVAIASGHGIGKTTLIAWVILWFISTREFPQIPVTANTQHQLLHKTWRELSKWHRLAINKHWFQWTATKFAKVEYPETWFATAVPWSKNNAEAFAGTHEKFVLMIYDEASAIADVIWETSEGAVTTPGAIWLAFGNMTRNNGRFFECFNKMKHRWITRQIDSRTAKKANRAQIDQWISDYGEDSDFVRVRVRGVAPRASIEGFIGQDLIDQCRGYVATILPHMPKVLSMDVARFGDDQSTVGIKQGRKLRVLAKWREVDLVTAANRLIAFIEQEQPDAIVIDGDGIGGGVIDIVKARGFDRKSGRSILTEFHGAGTPNDPKKYSNRRAEIWGLMREAITAGFDMGDDADLVADLTGPEFFYVTKNGCDVIQLESKKDMKARGLSSPDVGDMFAQTFAVTLRDIQVREGSARPRPTQAGSGGTAWMGV